jgi:uncharacterized protein (TIGR02284 family)
VNTNDKTISVLNHLIGISKDGQKGFANAAEHVKRPDLKTVFSEYSKKCASGATELQALVTNLGGDAKSDGTVGGALHRGLVDVKAAVAGHSDLAVLEECEKGEDVAKKAYSNALNEQIPQNIRDVISRQNTEVLEHHDKVRDLRNAARATATQ